MKLLQDIVIENNCFIRIIKKGTIIKENTITLDPPNEIDKYKETALPIVQNWIDTHKKRFRQNDWESIAKYIQKIVDAIHSSDTTELKTMAGNLGQKAKELSKSNPVAKETLEQIHTLLIKLVGLAQPKIGAKTANECRKILKSLIL
jgi:hypothetical protein